MDVEEYLLGRFELELVGKPWKDRVVIERIIHEYQGSPSYLITKDGIIYNWRNIISMNPA